MTVKNSGKFHFRFAFFSIVFILALSLGICGVTLGAPTINTDNVAYADWLYNPAVGGSLDIEMKDFNFGLSNFLTDQLSLSYDYVPNTYKNFYAHKEGVEHNANSIGTFNDTMADFHLNGSLNNGRRLSLYAYYKLPQELIDAGATITASYTCSVNTNKMNTPTKYFTLCDGPSGTNIKYTYDQEKVNISGYEPSEPFNRDLTSGSAVELSGSNKYLRLFVTATSNGTGLSRQLKVSNIKIHINVVSVKNIEPIKKVALQSSSAKPVVASWDGVTPLETTFANGNIEAIKNANFNKNNNIVGGVDWYKPEAGDTNEFDSALGISNINLISLRTDATKPRQKKFSFVLYDHYTGLKTANFKGLDLLEPYQKGTPETGAYTFTRDNVAFMPKGVKQITVTPFGYVDNATTTGHFRGLGVSVIYDGLTVNDSPITSVELDNTLNISYANYLGQVGKNLVVNIGGLDYKAPYMAEEMDFQTEFIRDAENKRWFDVGDIEYRIFAEDDLRDDINKNYRDVEYTYTLYKKANIGDEYVAVPGQENIKVVLNYNNTGANLKLVGLEKGYYKYTLTATDALYRANPTDYADHKVSNFAEFIVDTGMHGFNWKNNVTIDGGVYNGEWTNKPITISFNKIDKDIMIDDVVSMEYWFKGGKKSLDMAPTTLTLDPTNSFVIQNDKINYPTSSSESWYSEEGFERTYFFKLVLTSGKTYEFSQYVRFDDYFEEIPYSSILNNFNSANPYTDLLNLEVDIAYKVGNEFFKNVKGGSELTLWCKIGQNVAKFYDIVNDHISLDIFGGQNVTGPTSVPIELWFVDEAGNEGAKAQYNDFYVDTAKLYIKFSVNKTTRHYDNTTVTPEDLLSYAIYKDGLYVDAISKEQILATFTSQYQNKNAGLQNVLVKNIVLSATADSIYKTLLSKYQVVAIANDGLEYQVVNENTEIIACQHEILKARLAVGYAYLKDGMSVPYPQGGGNFVPYGNFIFEYKGLNNTTFEVGQDGTLNFANGTFVCLDEVSGDTWSDITWSATLSLLGNATIIRNPIDQNKFESRDANVKNAVLTGADKDNYVIVNRTGDTTNIKVRLTLTPKNITLTLNPLTKEYDGNTNINIAHKDYILNGVIAGEEVILDIAKMNPTSLASANVGNNYDVTIQIVLKGKNYINYNLVDNLDSKTTLTEATFTGVSVTPKAITIDFKNIQKTYDTQNTIVLTSANYKINGILGADSGNVTLNATATLPSANRGTYQNVPVVCELVGSASQNYQIVDSLGAVTNNLIIASAVVNPKAVKEIEFLGIYVYDVNGHFYYEDIAKNLYEEITNVDGTIVYNKYDTNGVKTANVELPADATLIVLKKYFSGGTYSVNDQHINLNKTPVYAFKYKDMSGNYIAGDHREDINQARVLQELDLTLTMQSTITTNGFAKTSNFEYKGIDNATCVFDIIEFAVPEFDGYIYWTQNGQEQKLPYTGDTIKVTFINDYYTLKLIEDTNNYTYEDMTKVDGNVGVKDAGTYKYTFKVTRKNDDAEIIVEKTVVIEKASVAIELTPNSTARYGENLLDVVARLSADTDAKYSALGVIFDDNNIIYEFCENNDFNKLISAPYRDGAGVYYVRAKYLGNNNTTPQVSQFKKFTIQGIPFKATNKVFVVGSDIEGVDLSSIVDGNYDALLGDFRVVYAKQSGDFDDGFDSKAVYTLDVPEDIGLYLYMVVHKDRIKNGELSSAFDSHLSSATTGIYKGTFTIGINSINSSDGNDYTENNVGIIEAVGGNNTNSSILPAVRVDLGELMFLATDFVNNTVEINRFNAGFKAFAEQIGGNYKAVKGYKLTLNVYDIKNGTKAVAPNGTVKVTLNTNEVNGTKLFMFDYKSDGTCDIKEVNYTNNGDGTVSFETDKLGYFTFANTYTPEANKGSNNIGRTIGAAVGGTFGGLAGIAILVILIMKKKAI